MYKKSNIPASLHDSIDSQQLDGIQCVMEVHSVSSICCFYFWKIVMLTVLVLQYFLKMHLNCYAYLKKKKKKAEMA